MAHSAKPTGQPGSTSGHNTCTFTLYHPVSLGRTTKPMAIMINVLRGCTWKKTQFNISSGVPQMHIDFKLPHVPADMLLCEYCGKEYISKTALHRHLKDKHPHEEEEEKEEVDLE